MVLPGRVPGYKRTDVKLLPSSTTKHQVWELCQEAAAEKSMKSVGYSTFTRLWRELLPYIIVMKPMTDLCWLCPRNSTIISRSSNSLVPRPFFPIIEREGEGEKNGLLHGW